MIAPRESVVDRFLRYVRINTESAEGASTVPSTAGQWDLARMLVAELSDLGAADVRLSDTCMVYATIPATVADAGLVPVVGFLAHVDTSPAVSGANVNPIVHAQYAGGDIVLPADQSQIITVAQNPDLASMIGDDIITTDGTTLLGSDDKAGVAAVMTMADVLLRNPDVPHGTIKIGFTSDEEIGSGIDHFDVDAFGAAAAYTVDGDAVGEINHETWSARLATITFRGKSTHPGTAKGVMVNATYALADFISSLPGDMTPETTDGRVGFLHPYGGTIDVETSTLKVILRDFERAGLDEKTRLMWEIAAAVTSRHRGIVVEVDVKDQYRNMNEVLKDHPQLVANALEAARRAGLTPRTKPIRGGTDGSRLTFRGLPCPNIFTGGHNFHSKQEFNSRRGLERTTDTLVHLAQVFAEKDAQI